jgi:quinol monooxygenase YgiN
MSVKWITLKAKSGSEEALNSCLDELRLASHKETGCLEYRVFRSEGTFYVLERYKCDEALAEHKASDHFIKAKAAFADIVESKGSEEFSELT